MARKKAVKIEHDGCEIEVVHLKTYKRAVANSLDDEKLENLSRMYKALGDKTRLKIVHGLSGGEMCVCDICAYLGANQSAVSHQLRLLRNLNLVKTRREGQVLFYSLDDDCIKELIKIGINHLHD
jgi:ArsR family transcriptional regulator, lead/cadmium/zinc/bismuth-responsive transcriptional repressor